MQLEVVCKSAASRLQKRMGCGGSLPEVPLVSNLVPIAAPLVSDCVATGPRCSSIHVPAYVMMKADNKWLGAQGDPTNTLTLKTTESSGTLLFEVHAREALHALFAGVAGSGTSEFERFKSPAVLEALGCPSPLVDSDGNLVGRCEPRRTQCRSWAILTDQ